MAAPDIIEHAHAASTPSMTCSITSKRIAFHILEEILCRK